MATKSVKKKEAQETISQPAETKVKVSAKKKTVKKAAAKKTAVKKTVKKATVKKDAAVKKTVIPVNLNFDGYLVVDHPVDMEIISGQHYAIRIGASQDGYVEISFNNGEWIPCRFGGGYWWFDWVYFTPGDYSIAARLVAHDGNTVAETAPRKCAVC
ncbi:MAG: hypothetical protein FWF00_06730 [Endomicrobia bacterium]|nr:hypothetical protein [Endomicrobiia bacterium]MCL2507359.1 hypothetical protein [Endomicrobiia bacterium]